MKLVKLEQNIHPNATEIGCRRRRCWWNTGFWITHYGLFSGKPIKFRFNIRMEYQLLNHAICSELYCE